MNEAERQAHRRYQAELADRWKVEDHRARRRIWLQSALATVLIGGSVTLLTYLLARPYF